MSKVNTTGRVPRQYDPSAIAAIFKDIESQINGISEGKVYATYNAHTAAPTGSAQAYQRGDFVKNTQPSEVTQTFIGSYVIAGWLNTSAGSPGTWKQCRFMTSDITLDSDGFIGTEWTDLTDGGTTTLHTHTSGTASAITVANEATDTSCYLIFTTAATGDLGPKSNANMTFNSSTGVATFASTVLTTTDINGGTIDGTAIGGASTSTGAFTTISASGQITSTVITGSAPLVVASTTKVTNLNADLLDDQSGAYYLDSANFTGTNWTDLTDGGTTTLHTHTSGTASAITVANEAVDTTCFPVFTTAATGDLGPKSNTGLTFNSNTGALGAVTLASTVATGTAPLTVASTTKVSNLNADLLDDQSGAYYLDSANFTGTNWTDLTDGGTTTLHTHTSGVASSITVANEATDTTCFPVFVTAATGDLAPKTVSTFGLNSSTGALTIGGSLTIGVSQVLTTRQSGWTAPSSTVARTTFATYPGQTITDNYGNLGTLFTQVQTIDDHVKVLSQRLGALITDLITHGLIGS